MPRKGYKAITITEKSNTLLDKIRELLKEKSKSSTANRLIKEKHTQLHSINTSEEGEEEEGLQE